MAPTRGPQRLRRRLLRQKGGWPSAEAGHCARMQAAAGGSLALIFCFSLLWLAVGGDPSWSWPSVLPHRSDAPLHRLSLEVWTDQLRATSHQLRYLPAHFPPHHKLHPPSGNRTIGVYTHSTTLDAKDPRASAAMFVHSSEAIVARQLLMLLTPSLPSSGSIAPQECSLAPESLSCLIR
ncbi:hypothetical protein BD289DRAFT_23504 [Coniella lustricola]|uniref:Uncharacterized protein n=1 Tax=Coniella lustricola TaxID=2025994 RepID=A0A2T3A3I3_9PEZI|nr:hypothetical protein BD289DRAFT_23504 [Coniella lustricola]